MKFTNLHSKLLLLLCFFSMMATVGFGQDNLEVEGRATIQRNGEALRLSGVNNWLSFYNGTQYNGYLNHTNTDLTLMNRQLGALVLGTNNSTRMTITEDGQVGIGTNTPHVNSILHATDGYMRFEPRFNNTGSGYIQMALNFALTPYLSFNDGASETIALSATGSSQIVNSLALGNNSAGDYKLKITHSNRGLNIQNSGANNNNWELFVEASANGPLALYNGANFRGRFNGTSGIYTPASDRRLKKNIEELESVLDKVMQLEPTRYQFIKNNKGNEETIGFIAQDVEKVFPEFVFKTADDRDNGLYTLDYTGFGTLAIKAIQEQQKIIESLQIENEEVAEDKVALAQRILSLEQKLNKVIKQLTSNK